MVVGFSIRSRVIGQSNSGKLDDSLSTSVGSLSWFSRYFLRSSHDVGSLSWFSRYFLSSSLDVEVDMGKVFSEELVSRFCMLYVGVDDMGKVFSEELDSRFCMLFTIRGLSLGACSDLVI